MTASIRLVAARPASEGAGVRIRRAIGTDALRHLDPFLLLDYFDSERASDYLAGFPDHPHRGFVTLTYMLAGRMEHRDSMGHQGVIGPGDAQWMKAASGIIHSEMPRQQAGRMAGFQLWVNLPAAHKMAPPEYQEYAARDIPVREAAGARVKCLAGRYEDVAGPVVDPHTRVRFLDVRLQPGAAFPVAASADEASFVFAYAGAMTLGERPVPPATLALPGPGTAAASAGPAGAAFLVVSGRPIGEPIVQHGPFVMNTREEVHRAVLDYHAGRLAQPVAAGRMRS